MHESEWKRSYWEWELRTKERTNIICMDVTLCGRFDEQDSGTIELCDWSLFYFIFWRLNPEGSVTVETDDHEGVIVSSEHESNNNIIVSFCEV
ncbi:hypothetical protein HZ326_14467 [Fusarium oxysporum f. sp. albedinis]|nr:hypothetical protein HZ326_14467 [Fusarium oxysporum f. sp. albedinis]